MYTVAWKLLHKEDAKGFGIQALALHFARESTTKQTFGTFNHASYTSAASALGEWMVENLYSPTRPVQIIDNPEHEEIAGIAANTAIFRGADLVMVASISHLSQELGIDTDALSENEYMPEDVPVRTNASNEHLLQQIYLLLWLQEKKSRFLETISGELG